MVLNDFKIIKFIGKGSYGSVYKVFRKSDEKEYAMKEVNIKPMSQKEREEAVNEIRLLASVRHPYIIGYYEAFCEGDKIYIITEYAEAGDLSRKIKRYKARNQAFDEEMIWSYFVQLCLGLRALHQTNILHRDLKTQNIFLMNDEVIKIGDLGVAKLLKEGNAQTQVGTPYYMSPEIWKNRPYDKKSDIWSLGCLLYEMVTFRHPFESNSWKGLANKVLKGQYQEIGTNYSTEMRDLVRCLLVTDPLRRPSVAEIMNMPAVSKRMHLLPPANPPNVPGPKADLLATIQVPRDLGKLRMRLPASNYPDSKCGTPVMTPLAPHHQVSTAASDPYPFSSNRPRLDAPSPYVRHSADSDVVNRYPIPVPPPPRLALVHEENENVAARLPRLSNNRPTQENLRPTPPNPRYPNDARYPSEAVRLPVIQSSPGKLQPTGAPSMFPSRDPYPPPRDPYVGGLGLPRDAYMAAILSRDKVPSKDVVIPPGPVPKLYPNSNNGYRGSGLPSIAPPRPYACAPPQGPRYEGMSRPWRVC